MSQSRRSAEIRIEYLPLSALKPAATNPKRHALDELGASIGRHGYVEPMVLDDRTGRLVAGHGRRDSLIATRKAGAKPPVGVRVNGRDWLVPVVRGWRSKSDADAEAYLIGANRLTELGGWDDAALAKMLKRLEADGEAALAGVGYGDVDIERLLRETGQSEIVEDEIPEPPKKPVTRRGDLWVLGDHRLLCGDSTDPKDVARLVGNEKAALMATDPPYGVAYDNAERPNPGAHKERVGKPSIVNDDLTDGPTMQAFLESMLRAASPSMRATAAYYFWHPMLTQGTYVAAAAAAGILIHRQIIWVKPALLMGRGDYHWRHELCQPPGTMVRVPAENKRGGFKHVPIETLATGDAVLAYDRYSKAIRGKRMGVPVKVGTRNYAGKMYSVTVGGNTTRATDGHLWSARLSPAAEKTWAVYLMRRGTWWRVGISKVLAPYGCGVKFRAKCERADATWILSTHATELDALCAEQIASVKYGIPRTHWRTNEKLLTVRTAEHVRRIYAGLDLAVMRQGAMHAMADHGRLEAYPLFEPAAYRDKVSRRVSMLVRSCNLLPHAMSLPVPHATGDDATWMPIEAVSRSVYGGPVYSLEVEKFHHYVADGIVTHNCFYGWRQGSRCPFYGPRNQDTIWEIGGVTSAERKAMNHATPKPVALWQKPIENHTRAGGVLYEPFSGSGTQIIAAEQLGRQCRAMEIEPRYVDVAVARWEKLTGRKARREKA